jgi:hypothetical protein
MSGFEPPIVENGISFPSFAEIDTDPFPQADSFAVFADQTSQLIQ